MKRKILMLFQKKKKYIYVFVDHYLLIQVTKNDLNSFTNFTKTKLSCFWAI